MMRKKFSGMGVALVTPFTSTGEIDYATLEKLVQMHIDCGTAFLCVQGTTAETPTLTIEEKREIRKRIIKQVDGRMPIMLGVGGNCTRAVVEELKTEDFTGVDAILSVAPYYNKPVQEGIYQHYKAIAEATELPIYMYNVPGRTGVNMTAETALRLAEIDNVVAIKEASGNKEQIMEILRNAPEGFQVLSGNDDDTLWMMENGGAGIISVASNVAPELLAEFVGAIRKYEWEKARELETRLTPLFVNCFVESNPIPAKAAMAAMGLIENELRLPLVPAQQKTYDLMAATVRNLGLL